MIKVDGTVINQEHFPDGSLLVRQDKHFFYTPVISWHYESDAELFTIICLKKHLGKAELVLPYIPHARMDRVKYENEIFTLKYFCEVINSLDFQSVTVLDPHSSVAPALLNNLIIINPEDLHYTVIEDINNKDIVLFYPDEGAMKRYSESKTFKEHPSTFGIKNRDWKTGKIKNYLLANPEEVIDKDVLIIDDICSYGGTFKHAALALKEAGARNIYLCVSHAENSMVKGDMYNEDNIKHIYTTDSIFKKENDVKDKVTVYEFS